MRRFLPLILIACTGLTFGAEGMWPPGQLPELKRELKEAGLAIGPGTLSDLTGHPMGAVVDLSGCSASFVSPRGLVVTNHHCAYGSLQYNSTEERNLLEDGFLAGSFDEEIPGSPGSRVRVTVDVRDVTEIVNEGLDEFETGAERYKAIEDRRKKLIAKCEKQDGHRCSVRSFFGGMTYSLIDKLEIRDVRLVYAPPGSIGEYGGDIDNWMWPRHTGDFAFFRAYVGADGKPADHSEDNVPFAPRHHLQVSSSGVREGDFVMVAGYPGRTGRYRLGIEVESRFEWFYPTYKVLLDRMLEIIEQTSEQFPDAKIKYAAMVAGLNNATKNFQGMLDGYERSGMLERKRALEQELQRWIASDEARLKRYGSSLEDLEALVRRDQATRERDMVLDRMGRSAMLGTARRLVRLSHEKQLPDPEREPGYQERDMTPFRERLERMDRRYHPEVDKALWRFYIESYLELPDDQRIAPFDEFFGLDDPSRLGEQLDAMYAKTRLDELEFRVGLMDATQEQLEASEDPFIRLAVALYESDRAREAEDEAIAGEFQLLRPRYMQTMVAFLESRGKHVYPDANSSLRVTYGNVMGYSPRDGIFYTPFTRLEGIREKYTGEDPFDSPEAQLTAIDAGEYGAYRLDSIGSVPVNFLSTVDTTGGNSGSPTLNGKGELVGLLFDGTYDSINADWDFNEETTRSIHVDIRYALWVMEKVDRATRVLEELDIR